RRPAPVANLEAEELDGEDVARLRALHVDGPGQGVDRVEIEREKVLGRRVPYDLPAREIVGLDNDDVARLDVEHGLDVDVPARVRGRFPADQVLAHATRTGLRRATPGASGRRRPRSSAPRWTPARASARQA